MTKQAVLLGIALAAIPALPAVSMAGPSEERPMKPAYHRLQETAGEADKKDVAVPKVGEVSAEVVLPPSRPAKTRLIPGELERLRSVAAEIFKNTPNGEESFGTFNVHRLSLKGGYQEDGGLKLESVTMTREFNTAPQVADKGEIAFKFTILSDGRIDDKVSVQKKEYVYDQYEWREEPLGKMSVQDVLRGELEFWLWGNGWRETTHISLSPSRRHH